MTKKPKFTWHHDSPGYYFYGDDKYDYAYVKWNLDYLSCRKFPWYACIPFGRFESKEVRTLKEGKRWIERNVRRARKAWRSVRVQ